MKYLGIYTSIKHFILNASSHWYRFLNRSDTWVEGQNHDTLSMWTGIGVVASLVFLVFIAWVVSRWERTPAEKAREDKRDNTYAHPDEKS